LRGEHQRGSRNGEGKSVKKQPAEPPQNATSRTPTPAQFTTQPQADPAKRLEAKSGKSVNKRASFGNKFPTKTWEGPQIRPGTDSQKRRGGGKKKESEPPANDIVPKKQ